MKVTDPELLAQLNASTKVTDPELLAQLESTKPDFQTSQLGRFLIGAQSAGEGIGQAVAHALPENLKVSVPFTDIEVTPKQYLEYGNKLHQEQEAKKKAANIGVDVAGFAGSLINPLAGATKNPIAQGALLAATQPAYGDNYALEKAGQIAAGGALGKVGDVIGNKVAGLFPKNSEIAGAKASMDADVLMQKVNDMDIPDVAKQQVRNNLITALKSGVKYDPAAFARQEQAKQLGINLTRGQATRDPRLYSQEVNLRAASPAISERFAQQEQRIKDLMSPLGAEAKESYQSGGDLMSFLANRDEEKRKLVSALYENARKSTHASYELPMQGLAQDYANILNKYGDTIPSAVRKNFEDFGLLTGKKLKMFTPNAADELEKTISSHYGNSLASDKALRELKDALRLSVEEGVGEAGPFTPAVKAAALRFKEHELVPAIPAAIDEKVRKESFIDKYIFKDSIDNVKRLAETLDQENFGAIKEKIGEEIRNAAYKTEEFGANAFKKKLKEIGDEKLSVFFTPQEIEKMKLLSNVSSYIKNEPPGSSVNRSNTAVALFQNSNFLNKFLPEAVNKTPVVNLIPTYLTYRKGQAATSGKLPKEAYDLSIANNQALAEQLRKYGVLAGGITGGQSINQ